MTTQPNSTPQATAEAPDKGVGCDALLAVLRASVALGCTEYPPEAEIRWLIELPMTDTQKRVWDAALKNGIDRSDNPQMEMLRASLEGMRAQRDRMRGALREVLSDFRKHGTSVSNYSDGEYTQDYTTRKERIEAALSCG